MLCLALRPRLYEFRRGGTWTRPLSSTCGVLLDFVMPRGGSDIIRTYPIMFPMPFSRLFPAPSILLFVFEVREMEAADRENCLCLVMSD